MIVEKWGISFSSNSPIILRWRNQVCQFKLYVAGNQLWFDSKRSLDVRVA